MPSTLVVIANTFQYQFNDKHTSNPQRWNWVMKTEYTRIQIIPQDLKTNSYRQSQATHTQHATTITNQENNRPKLKYICIPTAKRETPKTTMTMKERSRKWVGNLYSLKHNKQQPHHHTGWVWLGLVGLNPFNTKLMSSVWSERTCSQCEHKTPRHVNDSKQKKTNKKPNATHRNIDQVTNPKPFGWTFKL